MGGGLRSSGPQRRVAWQSDSLSRRSESWNVGRRLQPSGSTRDFCGDRPSIHGVQQSLPIAGVEKTEGSSSRGSQVIPDDARPVSLVVERRKIKRDDECFHFSVSKSPDRTVGNGTSGALRFAYGHFWSFISIRNSIGELAVFPRPGSGFVQCQGDSSWNA